MIIFRLKLTKRQEKNRSLPRTPVLTAAGLILQIILDPASHPAPRDLARMTNGGTAAK